MNIFKYSDDSNQSVIVKGDCNGLVFPDHRYWVEWGVKDAVSSDEVLVHTYEVTAYHKIDLTVKKFFHDTFVSDEYTLSVPTSDKCYWDGSGWIEDVTLWRENKKLTLRKDCESAINAGFQADILFPECKYRNDRDQQMTMRNASEYPTGGKIWMNESFLQHTKAQAQSVYDLSKQEIEKHRTRYADKCSYVNASERTAEEIIAVTWSSVE